MGLALGNVGVADQRRHDKRPGLELGARAAEGTVEPDADLACDAQGVGGIADINAEAVHAHIALGAQHMQHADHIRIHPLAADLGQQISLAGFNVGLEAMCCGNVLGNGLTELAQFQQAGIRVGNTVVFGGRTQLRQQRVTLFKKRKVGGRR